MSPRFRKIILLTFLAIFAGAAPAVLLRTAGYRYNWEKGRIEKTGTLHVVSSPDGAVVILNGAKQTKTTPASFRRLLPEDYRLRVEKAGYLPWEKNLTVASGQTTFASDIVLFRDAVPRLTFSGEIDAFAQDRSGKKFAVLRRDASGSSIVIVQDGSPDEPIAGFSGLRFPGARLSWSPDGAALLFHGGDRLMAYTLSTGVESRSLHGIALGAVRSARWSKNGESFVIAADSGVAVVSRDGKILKKHPTAGASDALFADGELYILRRVPSRSLIEHALRDGGTETIARLDGIFETFADASGGAFFVASDDGRLAEVGRDGIQRGRWPATEAAVFSDDRLLSCGALELAVTDRERKNTVILARLGSPVTGCAWHPSGRTVISGTAAAIVATEIDGRDRRNMTDLARFDRVGPFALTPDGKLLRFVGKIGNQEGVFEREL